MVTLAWVKGEPYALKHNLLVVCVCVVRLACDALKHNLLVVSVCVGVW